MKKLLSILFISTLLFSCSTDTQVDDVAEQQDLSNLDDQVKQGKFDTSSLGVYEGVFTSLVSNDRSTVRIELDGKTNPVVSFNFSDGDFKSFRAAEGFGERSEGSSTGALHFKGENFEFDFKVNDDGTDPVVTNVMYMGEKGDIIVMKETSRNAITPRTGSYSCTPGGCDNHPDLGVGKTQTFNAILQTTTSNGNVADDSQANIVFQGVLGGTVYYMASSTPSMTQTGCQDAQRTLAGGVVYDITRCNFTGYIQGGSGLAEIKGTHRYGRSVTISGSSFPINCSDYYGTFVYDSTILGVSTMTFVSDDVEGQDPYCFPAT